MRSDNLKGNMKKHVSPSLEDSKQLCKDIKSMYKLKDPHSDVLDESPVQCQVIKLMKKNWRKY